MIEKSDIRAKIANYYIESEKAYQKWGKDENRNGVYALHGGFTIEGQSRSLLEEVKELSRQLIRFSQIPPNSTILDAGCGVGALSFELESLHGDVRVFGINIAHNQLVSANTYRLSASVDRVSFSEQDYHKTAFSDNTFDVVIFCESFIHSWDKKHLAQEVFRILKPGGTIALSDTFIKKNPESESEENVINDLKSGWYLPSILRIQELKSILELVGFSSVAYREHTQNIIDFSRKIRKQTELRIREGTIESESTVLKLSRKAVIACNEALERGLTGYYFVKGHKLFQ